MHTKANRILLMSASAITLAIFGLGATFLPSEILAIAGAPASGVSTLIVQITGALYLAFAMVNWMGRTNLIGGIYSRPVATGNTLHFTMGALALLKSATSEASNLPVLLLGGIYSVFAISFALVLFTHPAPDPS